MANQQQWNREKVEKYLQRENKAKHIYRPIADKIVHLIEEYGLGNEITIADIGCGACFLLFEVIKIKPEIKIIGIDPSELMLEAARDRARERNIKDIELISGYAENIPLPESSVKIAVSQRSLHEWQNIDSGLKEIYRILQRGGILIIKDYNGAYPKWKIKVLRVLVHLTAVLKSGRKHLQHIDKWQDPQKVKYLLENTGFQVNILENKLEYLVIGRKV